MKPTALQKTILAAEREPNPPAWAMSRPPRCLPAKWPQSHASPCHGLPRTMLKLGGTVRTKWLHRGPAHCTKNCQTHWRSCTHGTTRHNTASSANLSRAHHVEFFRTNWISQNHDPCGVPHFVAQLFHTLWDLTCSVPIGLGLAKLGRMPAVANKISSNNF